MARKHKGQTELEAHGFTEIESRWSGIWFVAKAPDGEEVCLLRQGPYAWHAFFAYRATGSGNTPSKALTGGLGDVIGDQRVLMNYAWRVRNAPDELTERFEGLYEAGVQVVN